MPSDITIRLATADDTSDVLSLIRQLAEYVKEPEQVSSTVVEIAAALRGEGLYALVAHCEGEAFYPTYSTWLAASGLNLDDLFVVDAYRARGVGKLLLGHLGKEAEQHGCIRVESMVHHWNEFAIAFYEKRLGAKPVSDLKKEKLEGKEALRRLAQLAEQPTRP